MSVSIFTLSVWVNRQNGQVPVLGDLKSREIGRNRGREREKERKEKKTGIGKEKENGKRGGGEEKDEND